MVAATLGWSLAERHHSDKTTMKKTCQQEAQMAEHIASRSQRAKCFISDLKLRVCEQLHKINKTRSEWVIL